MWMSESLVVRLYGVGDVDKPRAMLETLTGELREERQINSGEFLATAEWAGRRLDTLSPQGIHAKRRRDGEVLEALERE